MAELAQLPPTVKLAEFEETKVPTERVKLFPRSIVGSLVFALTVGVPPPLLVIVKSLLTVRVPERIV